MQILCFGIRRAGVTMVTYIEDGRVVVKILPSIPKTPPPPLLERVEHHG